MASNQALCWHRALILWPLFALVACQVDDKDWQPPLQQTGDFYDLWVDASDFDRYMGVNLLTGEQSPDLANSDWHLALRRYQDAALSGGLLGGQQQVTASVLAQQSEFYDADGQPKEWLFLQAEAEDYRALLQPHYYDLSQVVLSQEGEQLLIGHQDHWSQPSAEQPQVRHGLADKRWVITPGQGRDLFALWFADQAISLDDQGQLRLSLQLLTASRQAQQTRFIGQPSTLSTALSPGKGVGLNLLQQQWVSPDEDWHLLLTLDEQQQVQVRLNGGISGNGRTKAQGPYRARELADLDASGRYSMGFTSDGLDNALTQWPRFVYLQTQGHQLRPNFRTFLVATEHQGQFIVQWLDYYHPEHGGSGHLRLRVQPLP